jgi:hypothetical protein
MNKYKAKANTYARQILFKLLTLVIDIRSMGAVPKPEIDLGN